jgi:hypothetical protein
MFDVGFSWNSTRCPRTIKIIAPRPETGILSCGVSTNNSSIVQVIPVSEIEQEIQRDEKNYKSELEYDAKRSELARQIAEHDSWYGFIGTLRLPTAKAKALAALNKTVSISRVVGERGSLIHDLVVSGHTVAWNDGATLFSGKKEAPGRILKGPTGAYFIEKDLTKTGLDFAEFLIGKR